MDYCIVNSAGTIENIIVCEDKATAANFGGVPSYDGAAIGEKYSPPPPPPTTDERLAKLEAENSKLKSQLQMQAQQQEFLENCLLEMGDVVYA